MSNYQGNNHGYNSQNGQYPQHAKRRDDVPMPQIQDQHGTNPEVNGLQDFEVTAPNIQNSKGFVWSEAAYKAFYEDAKNGMTGEELCKKYRIKNKKYVKVYMYDAWQKYGLAPIQINFSFDFSSGQRPLSNPKVGKNGALSISRQQLKRVAKVDAQEGTEFKVIPLADGRKGFTLVVVE